MGLALVYISCTDPMGLALVCIITVEPDPMGLALVYISIVEPDPMGLALVCMNLSYIYRPYGTGTSLYEQVQ